MNAAPRSRSSTAFAGLSVPAIARGPTLAARWRTMVNDGLYRQQKAIGAIYRAQLAEGTAPR